MSPKWAQITPAEGTDDSKLPAGRAFPNAYLETDEPPRRSTVEMVLASVAIAGVGYLGLVILFLSLLTSEYSPITQVASDYGVGTYAAEMNTGFLVAGIGSISLALVGLLSLDRRSAKAGSILYLPAGVALVLNAFFSTDIEGAASTLHGTIHALGGVVFFFTAPVALLLVARSYGGKWFALTLLAVVLAVSSLIFESAIGLDATGLAERVLILVLFSGMILDALRILRRA